MKRRMVCLGKKLIALTSITCMIGMGVVGCGNQEVVEGGNQEKVTVGIVQIVEHPSLDTIRESIVSTLEQKGWVDGKNIEIDYQNAQNDQSNLNSICNKFVGDGVDVIVAIATPSAQAAAAATDTIPIVFSAVTDPVGAMLVENMEKPERNITGTSDLIPVDKVFDLCKKLTPEVKKIGFLYTASEVNSQSVIENAKQVAKEKGMTYEEMTITNTSELQQVAQSLATKVDAIYTPIDNSVASAMPVLAEVGRQTETPVYVGADSMVADGGYATVGIKYEDLGARTAEMVDEILKGTKVADIPVATLDHFQTFINETTANAIKKPNKMQDAIIMK